MVLSSSFGGCWRGRRIGPVVAQKCPQDVDAASGERNDGLVGDETNEYYRDFVAAMRGIGYKGYFSYELCHQLPVVNGQTVGIEFADRNAELAAEFMRGIIHSMTDSAPKVAAAVPA